MLMTTATSLSLSLSLSLFPRAVWFSLCIHACCVEQCGRSSSNDGNKLILTATTAEEALELCVKHHAENQNLKINTDENMKAVEKKKKTEEKEKEEGQTGGNGEKIEINEKEDVVRAAIEARAQSLKLQALDTASRRAILLEIAKTLAANKNEILEACRWCSLLSSFQVNKEDIKAAQSMKMSKSMRKRLVMDAKKIENLCKGITQIANDEDPIGQLVSATELSKKLILHQKTVKSNYLRNKGERGVPIGVLLIIFESRPDCLPQIAALSIKSGNGLLLKGGKEARMSCRFLHKLITQAVEKATKGKVSSGVVSLVETRQEIAQLLSLDHVIDLVIPRGSYGLVNFIKSHTKIPVLGHADGICHIFLDTDLDVAMAIRLIIDAKLNYAAACNAVENVLFHEGLFEDGRAGKILAAVRKEGIQVHASKEISQLLGKDTTCAAIPADTGFSTEYGDNRMSIHVVKNVSAAMRHINEFGSGHTDCIVTNNKDNVEAFLTGVASACVFHNASTRFADGFRFGLGAEVGISTGKIHARGPVGVKGLTTTQWTLASGFDMTLDSFQLAHSMHLTCTVVGVYSQEARIEKLMIKRQDRGLLISYRRLESGVTSNTCTEKNVPVHISHMTR
eukprot:jgi/Bigna1/85111/estExt_fgenesh1_pg.C_20195